MKIPEPFDTLAAAILGWISITAITFAAFIFFPILCFTMWFMIVFVWAFFDGGFKLFKFTETTQAAAANMSSLWPVFLAAAAVVGGFAFISALRK